MAFLCTCFEVEILNSGNDNLNIRFWLVVHNLTIPRIFSCIVLIMRKL